MVYNEEAAGRPGTGSSHYRRSSSATRLSVLVARHANVERPARCTCSCAAHRSSVTAAPHTRALFVSLRASPPPSSRPPFLFEPASGLLRSFCSIRAPLTLAALSSPSDLLLSFLLEQANVFRVFASSSSSSSTSSASFCWSERVNRSRLPPPSSSFLPFSHDRFTTRVVSSVLVPATRPRRSLSRTPA